MTLINNRIVLDLKKVQHATQYYVNVHGNRRELKPQYPTVFGSAFNINDKVMDSNETMLERATRLHLLDVWTPVVCFQLTANHTVRYSGPKALSLWKAWQAYVFKKTSKHK